MCVHEESRCHSDHNNSIDINSTRQSADHRVLFILQLNRQELRLTLGMILNVAKEDGLINITPAKSKRLRNPSSKKSVQEAPTSDETDDIESYLQDIPQSRDRRYVAMLLKSPRLI